VAASGTGNASNSADCYGSGVAVSCAAVSGTAAATNDGGHCGNYFAVTGVTGGGVSCTAVSGTGDATNSAADGVVSCGGVLGCTAVSATGAARNSSSDPYGCGSGWLTPLDVSIGCIAVSGTGPATNDTPNMTTGCGQHSTLYPNKHVGVGCVAIGATASNSAPACAHGTLDLQSGVGVGCLTLSVSLKPLLPPPGRRAHPVRR